jgi:hypothetical protein
MKKLVWLVMGAGLAVTGYGQGLVSMNSAQTGGYVRFSNNVANVAIAPGWVQNAAGATQGSLGYLNAALYWGTAADAVINPVSPLATFGSGTTAGLVTTSSGGGSRTVRNLAGDAITVPTYFQLRAWTGPFQTYEAALASGDPNVLVSTLTGARSAPIVLATPSTASGLPATIIAWGGSSTAPTLVQMVPAPEPSTLALVGLGLMGLIFIRRRK